VVKNTKRPAIPAPPTEASFGEAADDEVEGFAVEEVVFDAEDEDLKVVRDEEVDEATDAAVEEAPPANGAELWPLIWA